MLELQTEWTPSQIASAMAFWMGVYGMVLGFLNLGFLLEFVSLPVLAGWITAVAITIILNQLPSLLGIKGVGSGTAQQIHDIFAGLPRASGWTCLVGFMGILFMTILEKAGARWSARSKIVWFLSITRAFSTLVLFTGISYAVNQPRGQTSRFLFEVTQVKANGQEAPAMPPPALLGETAMRSIALFIGAAVEHCAIARAFGVKNDYVPDQTQELCYFGVTNFVNSFFHAMGVGGAMSRTSVNSQCNVKSPLSGVVTTAVVLICIYFLVPALFWIPKATLAAIIITAVWNLIHSPSHFYHFWKTSLADFISSMLALWVALFVNAEIGIAVAVGFNIVYCLLRQTFARVKASSDVAPARSELARSIDAGRDRDALAGEDRTRDVHVFRFTDSFFFPNSYATTTAILDSVQTYHAPAAAAAAQGSGSSPPAKSTRNWSVVAEQRIRRLRKAAGVVDASTLPPIGLVVLDFTRVNHADSTACTHLQNLVKEVRRYGGAGTEVRFVGMSPYVRERFVRYGWKMVDDDGSGNVGVDWAVTRVYGSVPAAVLAPRLSPSPPVTEGSALRLDTADDPEKAHASHIERSSSPEESGYEKRQG